VANGGGEDNVVETGDVPADRATSNSLAPEDKKIPNDQRTTTPYMTKYERARVLGARATQIRYAKD
jgi:DNA-directed RNA polymerase I, II, and III subunit RPABC2